MRILPWRSFTRQFFTMPIVWLFLGCTAPAFAETGHNSYILECQGCHGIDGGGSVASVPALKDHMAQFLLVPGGREFLVQVPGSAQSPLSDQELTDTLNWMLSEFGPNEIVKQYPEYSIEEVSRWRKSPLIDVKGVREKLMQAMAGRTPPLQP